VSEPGEVVLHGRVQRVVAVGNFIQGDDRVGVVVGRVVVAASVFGQYADCVRCGGGERRIQP
jgi:hypothetical protein